MISLCSVDQICPGPRTPSVELPRFPANAAHAGRGASKCAAMTQQEYNKKRRSTPELRDKVNRQTRESWARHKEKRLAYDKSRPRQKVLARNRIRVLIYRGKLKRQPCEVCGNELSQAHHKDYSKPLDVTWLCAQHHKEAHRV